MSLQNSAPQFEIKVELHKVTPHIFSSTKWPFDIQLHKVALGRLRFMIHSRSKKETVLEILTLCLTHSIILRDPVLNIQN